MWAVKVRGQSPRLEYKTTQGEAEEKPVGALRKDRTQTPGWLNARRRRRIGWDRIKTDDRSTVTSDINASGPMRVGSITRPV